MKVDRDGRDTVDAKIMAAIVAAVQAYMDQEDTVPSRIEGHLMSPWKMGARKEQLGRRLLAARVDPRRMRINRFSR